MRAIILSNFGNITYYTKNLRVSGFSSTPSAASAAYYAYVYYKNPLKCSFSGSTQLPKYPSPVFMKKLLRPMQEVSTLGAFFNTILTW